MEVVVGFASSPHLPSSQEISCRNCLIATATTMVTWLEVLRATTTKRRAQNKSLVRHPARGLNLNRYTIQVAHACLLDWCPEFGRRTWVDDTRRFTAARFDRIFTNLLNYTHSLNFCQSIVMVRRTLGIGQVINHLVFVIK